MSSGSGTFQLHDLHGLRSYYRAAGSVDLYGYPLGEEYAAGDGVRQDFERGYLIWDPATGITGYSFAY